MPQPAVLFVCAANRCRSPLAAALLQRLLTQQADPVQTTPDQPSGTWRIESAGLHAQPDQRATLHTQAAARLAGVDLSQHRARPIERVALDDFALILTMEEVQADALRAAYPDHAHRIYPFSQLVNLQVDIGDPTGSGLGEHQATLHLLERYLRVGWPRLLRLVSV